MDRIINVKVGGNHLSKDNKNAGVKGEANVTYLRITFDEGWDGYAKTVTFFDALGGNPVKRLLTVDLIEDIVNDTRTYITSIPKEPLAITGEMIFIIDGFYGEFVKNENGDYEIAYADKSKRQRSIADKLVVKDAPNTDTAGEPTDPTPTEPEQWQAQIEKIKDDIQQVAISKEETNEYAEDAHRAAEYAGFLAQNAQNHEIYAFNYANEAKASADDAKSSAEKAETAIKHEPTIIDGYWHTWDATNKQYVDTGVKAQSGSTVWYGDNPPDDADVWIDPEGESAYNEIKNYIDEQTEIIKSDVEGLQAQINEEAHFRGYVSTNAKIQALEATPNDFAYSAESGTKWVYDAKSGWVDTGKPVPDQLTPASDTTPLINGVASVGSENAYARGDHRHPTDTTRASVEDLNDLDKRVTTNEQSIAGAFTYCGELDTKISQVEIDVISNKEVIDSNVDRIIALEDNIDDIETSIDFELIEKVTTTEDVAQIIPNLNGNEYKELYVLFTVPTLNQSASSSFQKARVNVYAQNNTMIFNAGSEVFTDNGQRWTIIFTIQMCGKRTNIECIQSNNETPMSGFSLTTIRKATGVNLDKNSISTLKFEMTPANIRYFPTGTTYEIWGVRA